MKRFMFLLVITVLTLGLAVASSFGAGSQDLVTNGVYTETYDVTFSADDDTYFSMLHGLGSAPDEYTITALDANCLATSNTIIAIGNSGMPYINGSGDVGASAVGIAKGDVQGSSTCKVRVLVRVIHSIIK